MSSANGRQWQNRRLLFHKIHHYFVNRNQYFYENKIFHQNMKVKLWLVRQNWICQGRKIAMSSCIAAKIITHKKNILFNCTFSWLDPVLLAWARNVQLVWKIQILNQFLIMISLSYSHRLWVNHAYEKETTT